MTSRVMKGAAVSLSVSLSTLSARARTGRVSRLSFLLDDTFRSCLTEQGPEGVYLVHSHTARWEKPDDKVHSVVPEKPLGVRVCGKMWDPRRYQMAKESLMLYPHCAFPSGNGPPTFPLGAILHCFPKLRC